MRNSWEIYENLNEYVYVADAKTHNLVFVNRKLREAMQIGEQEDYSNRKCYELIKKCSAQCATCSIETLEPGQFREWKSYNAVLDKYLLINDTVFEENGKLYQMELAFDISTQEKGSEKLQDYQDMERFVYDGLRIAMSTPTPDASLDVVLEYLGRALKGERTYVFEKNGNGGDDNTYEWVAYGVTAEKDNLQNLPAEVCAHWYESFQEDKNIVIKDLEDIREEDPLQYENLKRQGIHSLVVVPLYDGGKAIGFYGVDNPPQSALGYTSTLLRIMGYFMVTFIRRRNLLNRLREMSVRDQLTKLGNRYAMEDYIRVMQKESCRGALYCDLTGLKHVNDTRGHEAGDHLIVCASECLKRIFDTDGIFRIGGDEFLVLCKDTKEEVLTGKAQRLQQEAEKEGVVLAVGCAWEKESGSNIHDLLVLAETRMYEDKKAYYRRTGIERRR